MKFNFVVKVFAALLIAAVTGCQPQQQSTSTDSIINGRQINANCIVTFFRPNTGNYYSRQKHVVSLDSQAMTITANEPQGSYTWQLTPGGYNEILPQANYDAFAVSVMNKAILKALITSITASPDKYSTDQQSEKNKVQGRWYYPIKLQTTGNLKTTVYKRLENNMIDLVTVEDTNTGSAIFAKPFNRRRIQNDAQSVPTKIDISSADSIYDQPKLILQVNYKSLAAR